MGYQLRREVRDLIPRGGRLTDKEARLVLELADSCNDRTRRGWPGVEWLAATCDIPNPKRVGEFFNSIARKWVELRVEIGKDKNGKPYYAKSGHKTVYRIPTRTELIAVLGPDGVPTADQLAAIQVPATGGPQVPATGGPFSSKNSSKNSSSSSSAHERHLRSAAAPAKSDEEEDGRSRNVNTTIGDIARALSMNPADALAVWQKIQADTAVHSPAKYVGALIANGDINRYRPRPKPDLPPASRCAYADDPRDPGRCATCHTPRANQRHQEAA